MSNTKIYMNSNVDNEKKKMNSKFRFLKGSLSILMCVLIFMFTACSEHHNVSNHTIDPGEELATATPGPSPIHGGVMRLPMPENVQVSNQNYNPLIVRTEEMLNLYSLVYDGLLGIDNSNMLVPSLAQSWTPDPETENAWIINLRKGVSWHDGSMLTADDVVFTYNEIYILGNETYYSTALSGIKLVEKLDEHTLRITMNTPGMSALYCLNFPIIKENSEKFTGTGAYRASYVSGERIVLVANNDWWDRTPYIETIEFIARSSNDTALASYGAGLLDFVPTAQLTVGQYSAPGETIVQDVMTQNMEVLLINHNKEFCRDVTFRSAIAHAINRSNIIANIYMNRAMTSDVPFPPDSWLYDSSQVVYNYNTETALYMLGELGFMQNNDGHLLDSSKRQLKLTILTSSTTENTTRADAAGLIAAQLEDIGIMAEVITAPHTYGESESEFMIALNEGNWDLALTGFNLSEGNELGKYLLPEGSNNFGAYDNYEMSSFVQQMLTAMDEESLRSAAFAVQELFVEELPFIVLYFRLNSVVHSADIMGMTEMREPLLLRNIKNGYLLE